MSSFAVIDEWDGGVGWMAHPSETMQRASHAIRGDDGLWLVDPLDAPGIDDFLDERGDVAGIVLTIGRHERDAGTFADRYDVSIHLPGPLFGGGREYDAPVAPIDPFSEATGWAVIPVIDRFGWREAALVDPAGSVARIGEAIGTSSSFRAPKDTLAVHPVLRLWPPRKSLGKITAETILVGHGEGVMGNGVEALHEALATARRRAPTAYRRALAMALDRGS